MAMARTLTHAFGQRARTALALLCCVFVLVSCNDPQTQIAGRWKVTSDTSGLVWDFVENGVVSSGDMKGRYSFGASKQMKIQTPFATFVYQVDFAGDKMTWKNANGSVTELTRVK
jgi:hypothetical protein